MEQQVQIITIGTSKDNFQKVNQIIEKGIKENVLSADKDACKFVKMIDKCDGERLHIHLITNPRIDFPFDTVSKIKKIANVNITNHNAGEYKMLIDYASL